MGATATPHVTIVTPVHNGERYLAECIESVLRQTYAEWRYVIVNNASTDSTLDIATRYSALDGRIGVVTYEEFVGVIESHNRALRHVSPASKYCKVLAADDWLFPECVARMVAFAEAEPSVGIVGAYTLSGNDAQCRVKYDVLSYRTVVVPGREACRWHLLSSGRDYFGVPTSLLYRSDLVRRTSDFFPNLRAHADVSVFYECLRTADFGFIHQVLSFERIHEKALSTKARQLSTYTGSRLLDLGHYGPMYLTREELSRRKGEALHGYYWLLAGGVINCRGKRFWQYHKAILAECGSPVSLLRLATAVCMVLLDLCLAPKVTLKKIVKRIRSRVTRQEEQRA